MAATGGFECIQNCQSSCPTALLEYGCKIDGVSRDVGDIEERLLGALKDS